MSERAKGKAKEAYGAMVGDEGKEAEGQAQHRKDEAMREREQKEADWAEQSRDEQERKDRADC